MPTKAQTDNLIPFTSEQSRDEAKINGQKGGIASGIARKEKKLFKEEILKRLKEEDWDEMILNLIERSKNNDNSMELLRDTIGQKPAQEIKAEVKEDVTINVGVQ